MKNRRSLAKIACLIAAGILSLSACSSAAQDRDENSGGTESDFFADATNVTLVRNVDDVPNVALFCAEGFGFAATLSGDGTRSPELVRMPELDETCPAPNAKPNPEASKPR